MTACYLIALLAMTLTNSVTVHSGPEVIVIERWLEKLDRSFVVHSHRHALSGAGQRAGGFNAPTDGRRREPTSIEGRHGGSVEDEIEGPDLRSKTRKVLAKVRHSGNGAKTRVSVQTLGCTTQKKRGGEGNKRFGCKRKAGKKKTRVPTVQTTAVHQEKRGENRKKISSVVWPSKSDPKMFGLWEKSGLYTKLPFGYIKNVKSYKPPRKPVVKFDNRTLKNKTAISKRRNHVILFQPNIEARNKPITTLRKPGIVKSPYIFHNITSNTQEVKNYNFGLRAIPIFIEETDGWSGKSFLDKKSRKFALKYILNWTNDYFIKWKVSKIEQNSKISEEKPSMYSFLVVILPSILTGLLVIGIKPISVGLIGSYLTSVFFNYVNSDKLENDVDASKIINILDVDSVNYKHYDALAKSELNGMDTSSNLIYHLTNLGLEFVKPILNNYLQSSDKEKNHSMILVSERDKSIAKSKIQKT